MSPSEIYLYHKKKSCFILVTSECIFCQLLCIWALFWDVTCESNIPHRPSMRYIRTGSFKKFFHSIRKSRSFDEQECQRVSLVSDQENKNGDLIKDFSLIEPSQSPRCTWKSFSFNEIFRATNGFSSGTLFLSLSLPPSLLPSLCLSLPLSLCG